jgi:putative acyl-CoA dehydrogenase
LPRLYRDIPVNSVWEGSGNVQCLDVLRSMRKEPRSLEAVFNELDAAKGANEFFDAFLLNLKDEFSNPEDLEFRARATVEKFALLLQAKVLLRGAPNFVAEAFCRARLSENKNLNFGTLPVGVETAKIIERSMVKINYQQG